MVKLTAKQKTIDNTPRPPRELFLHISEWPPPIPALYFSFKSRHFYLPQKAIADSDTQVLAIIARREEYAAHCEEVNLLRGIRRQHRFDSAVSPFEVHFLEVAPCKDDYRP